MDLYKWRRKIAYQKPIPIDASPPEAGVAISNLSVIARLPVREAVAIS
jgi:hypothetical protein